MLSANNLPGWLILETLVPLELRSSRRFMLVERTSQHPGMDYRESMFLEKFSYSSDNLLGPLVETEDSMSTAESTSWPELSLNLMSGP